MPAAVLPPPTRDLETAEGMPPAGPPRSPVRLVGALAWFEGRKLLRHPAFLIGVALTPLMLRAGTGDTEPTWLHLTVAIALSLVPLGWLTLVATNLGALRSRRYGMEDLLESLPTTPATRTTAHVLSTLATVPVSVLFAAVTSAWVGGQVDPTGTLDVTELATGVLLVVGGGAVGVLVARWLPRPAVCFPAILVTILIQGQFSEFGSDPAIWLGFLIEPVTDIPGVELRQGAWHVGWLTAWIALVAVAAVARHGAGRRLGTVALGAALVALGTGWAQTRPVTAEQADAVADYFARPAAHQACQEEADVRYCAYEDLGRHMADWRPPVEGVLARLPASARAQGFEVTERPSPVVGNLHCSPVGFLSLLPERVRDRLTPEGLWPADGKVHPGTDTWPCSYESVDGLFLGVQTGAWAVGLPSGPWHLDERCRAPGQARAVAALWLGAQSTPGAGKAFALLSERTDRNSAVDLIFTGWDNPPAWGVTFAATDVAAALTLLDRPAGDVAAVLQAGWDRFTDPGTPASELLAQAGVPAGAGTGGPPVAAGEPGSCP